MATELDILVDTFWNYVRLGQWELSQATANVIKDISQEHYHDLLSTIVLQPKNHSSGSRSVPTPIHLSWLALQEIKKNAKKGDSTLSTLPVKELEFNLLLHHLRLKATPSIHEELVAYRSYITKTGKSEFISPKHLSATACDFLSTLIVENPLLGSSLIDSLLGKVEKFSLNDFSVLQILTSRASSLVAELAECEDDYFKENFDNNVQVIAMLQANLEWTDPLLLQQYGDFVNKTLITERPDFSKHLWSAFLNDKNPSLLKATHDIEEKYHLTNIESATKDADISDVELISELLRSTDGADWEKIFLFCYKNKLHILQFIIEGCVQLIENEKHDTVTSILSTSLLKPLVPLVLLISWTKCTSFEQAEILLDHLIPSEGDIDGILTSECKKLIYQTKLIKWCMLKAREILGEKFDDKSLLNVLFKQLEHSSVLFVLNETKLLRTLQYEEVVDLLEKQIEIHESYKSSSEQHISTYLCYTIMKKYVGLLVASKLEKITNECNIEMELTTEVLKDHVSNLKTDIEKIQTPIEKVEILENIFSLLFVRNSDFKGSEREDIDHDNIEDSSRDSSMSQSLDSNVEDGDVDIIQKGIKKAQRSLIFELSEGSEERKILSKDDINQALLQEIQDGSSSDTIKPKDNYDSFEHVQDMPPTFLASTEFVKETLDLVTDCLMSLSLGRFSASKLEGMLHDQGTGSALSYRISSLQAYTREAQWRLQLISGFDSKLEVEHGKFSKCLSRNHVISRMLGSSQSLVYLTLKKGDFIQAKQVVKMFSLKDQFCSIEMDFIEEMQNSCDRLKQIRQKKQKKEQSYSTMDFVKSAASAGKLSSEVNQMAENLLHHSFVVSNEIDAPPLSLAICFDLMFAPGITIHVAKSLCDLACLKLDGFHLEPCFKGVILEKAKEVKQVLNFILNRNLELFKLCGEIVPEDFLELSLILPASLSSETLEFEETNLSQGKSAFKILAGTISVLQSRIQELREPRLEDTPGVGLKETENNLLTILSSDMLTQFNQISTTCDYFKSIFRYVKNLAGLQLFFETKSDKDSNTTEPVRPLKVANPYILFNEKISTIFGRLLFDWDLSPKKLEIFAKQSGVNLIKVITENCGVVEGVKAVSKTPLLYSMALKETNVLNKHNEDSSVDETLEVDDVKSPNIAIEEILAAVLDMISESGEDTPLSLSEVCQVLNISTKQLRDLDVNLLQTPEEQLAFFINLFNLLFLHAIMLIASDRFDASLGLTVSRLSNVLKSPLGRGIFFHLVSYTVGQLGKISAFDIYNFILLDGVPNDFFGVRKERKILSGWKNLIKKDPRVLFVLSFGTCDCPMMQVMNSKSIEVILKSSTMEYIDSHIKVDTEKSQICLPETLFLHKNVFLEADKENDQYHHDLISSISNYAGPTLKSKLQLAVEEKYQVIIEHHNWKSRYPLYCGNSFTNDVDKNSNKTVAKFSAVPPAIRDYMKESCRLAGTFIEVFVVKNNVLKETTLVFNNNLLCSASNKKDTPLNIVSSLKNGLTLLTKICSDFVIFRNFVVESCSYMLSILEQVSQYEQILTSTVRKQLHQSLEEALSNKFLSTFSTDTWSHLFPSLLACCLETGNCHKLNLEFLAPMSADLFDLVMIASVHEIKKLLLNKHKLYVDLSDPLVHELKRVLLLIKDLQIKSDLTLDVLHFLSAKDVFDLLIICLEHKEKLDEDLCERIEKKLKETKWCDQVYNMCMLSTMHDAFTCWQDVQAYVADDPDYVTWFLNDTNAYELMDIWFDLYQLPLSNQQRCVQSQVLHVLKEPCVTDLKIQNAFTRSKSKEMSLKICRNILAMESPYDPNRKLINHFMLSQLCDKLLESEKRNCMSNSLGIMCIELIPEDIRDSYKPLEHKPLLILEQLLMNLKVKVAGKVVELIHREVGKQYGQWISGLSAQCDDLLGRYALLSIKMETMHREKKDDLSGPSSPVSSRVEEEPRERKISNSSFTRGEKSLEFIPPTSHIKKEDWVKDEKVSSCMQCHQLFSMFNRRHHCRHCGRVVCATCSNYFCLMAGFERKERACRPCYHYLENIPIPNQSPRIVRSQSMDRTFDAPSPPPIRSNHIPEWILSPEESANTSIHEEFLFEQAPNASLCLAIVDLYTNSKAASGLLLKFCNDLSQYLQGPNPEVDVTIVSSMIEFILNHAKLKFMKNGDFGGVELCDTHISRVEILKLLLESNWRDIPTMQEFAQPETLRRLRDKLMENERFALALELTSKCGLDATPVHFLMGISRLKCGHLDKAREHLARCLTKTSGEASSAFGPNHHYLQRIIDVIENTPLIALYHGREGASISLILQDQAKNCTNKCTLDVKRYNEIVYYLREYGSHGHMIKFFVRNRLVAEAVVYIREKKCSHDLFMAHLLQPSFQDGTFEEVCEKLRANDPSLKFWQNYLTAACKHLEKHGNFHTLYEIQLFIRDYFRAALTCVRFYLGTTGAPPSSYVDLSRRLGYLQKATKHLEHLIKERSTRSSFVSHVGSSFLGDDKTVANQDIPTSKLKQHLNTVNLQSDVTNFLNNSKFTSVENGGGNPSSPIPTLFGNGKERAELIVMLLMRSVDESLPLASRIIQEFKLPSSPIFGRAVARMAHEQKYSRVTSVLQNIEKNGMINSMEKDEILLKVIKVIVQKSNVKDATQFIKQIRGEPSKINAFIICGRLRDAYLEAVKKERVNEIQRILDAARQASNQKSMVDICEKWLQTHHDNQIRKEQALSQKANKSAR